MAPRHFVTCANLALLRNTDAHQLVDAWRQFITGITREDFDFDDLPTLAVWDTQRGIFYFTSFLTKDGSQEFLFSRELRLTFRRNLPNQDILCSNFCANINDAPLIEILQAFFTNVWDVPGDLFRAKFGVACIDLVFFNVNRASNCC